MKKIQAEINKEDKDLIEKLLSAGHIQYKYAIRLQTIFLRAKGKGTNEISEFLGIHQSTVSKYINKYNKSGIDSMLRDKTRKPGKEPISQKTKNRILRLVSNEKPKGETHWRSRKIAQKAGISHSSVSLILRECGLKLHITSKRNYSNDPNFESKLTDVIGLYMKAPENSIILCVDEKSQIQALERSRSVLPLIRNVPER